GVRAFHVTGVQTCALPISDPGKAAPAPARLPGLFLCGRLLRHCDRRHGTRPAPAAILRRARTPMRKIITFTAAIFLTASAFGAGEVYRWKAADGTWHFSDQPRPGAEVIRGPQLTRPVEEAAPQPAPAPVEPPVADEPLPVSDV